MSYWKSFLHWVHEQKKKRAHRMDRKWSHRSMLVPSRAFVRFREGTRTATLLPTWVRPNSSLKENPARTRTSSTNRYRDLCSTSFSTDFVFDGETVFQGRWPHTRPPTLDDDETTLSGDNLPLVRVTQQSDRHNLTTHSDND